MCVWGCLAELCLEVGCCAGKMSSLDCKRGQRPCRVCVLSQAWMFRMIMVGFTQLGWGTRFGPGLDLMFEEFAVKWYQAEPKPKSVSYFLRKKKLDSMSL